MREAVVHVLAVECATVCQKGRGEQGAIVQPQLVTKDNFAGEIMRLFRDWLDGSYVGSDFCDQQIDRETVVGKLAQTDIGEFVENLDANGGATKPSQCFLGLRSRLESINH